MKNIKKIFFLYKNFVTNQVVWKIIQLQKHWLEERTPFEDTWLDWKQRPRAVEPFKQIHMDAHIHMYLKCQKSKPLRLPEDCVKFFLVTTQQDEVRKSNWIEKFFQFYSNHHLILFQNFD